MLKPWLKLFRVVNLPTVPGDVLVGAAAAMWWIDWTAVSVQDAARIGLVAVSSCFLYMFGLVDNDIVGAATDKGRPIPDGEISMRDAKIARGLCLALGIAAAASAACYVVDGVSYGVEYAVMFAICQIVAALALVAAIVAYNRTKRPVLMGLCRGLNVVLGAASVAPFLLWLRLFVRVPPLHSCAVALVVAAWVVYVAAVTQYSSGEERDPERRRKVGRLVGGLVYMQLVALIAFTIFDPTLKPLLVAGAVLLVLLRVVCRAFPKVSAS